MGRGAGRVRLKAALGLDLRSSRGHRASLYDTPQPWIPKRGLWEAGKASAWKSQVVARKPLPAMGPDVTSQLGEELLGRFCSLAWTQIRIYVLSQEAQGRCGTARPDPRLGGVPGHSFLSPPPKHTSQPGKFLQSPSHQIPAFSGNLAAITPLTWVSPL